MSFIFVVSVIVAYPVQVASKFVVVSKRIGKRIGYHEKEKFSCLNVQFDFHA